MARTSNIDTTRTDTARAAESPRATRRESATLGYRLRRLAVIVVVVPLVFVALGRWTGVVEAVAFFHPAARGYDTPPGVEEVTFETPDGRTLHGWFMPARGRSAGDGPAPAILHCHGNEGSVKEHAGTSAYITRAGVSVLCFDYRGFGKSTPASLLSREELMTDAEAAYAYLRSRKDVDPKRIGVFGYSLGGAYAAALAAEHPEIRCVATVAAFSSWGGVASDFLPVLGRLLIRSGLAPEDAVARFGRRPYLIVHGDHDEIVACRHGACLFDAAKRADVPVEMMSVEGIGHLDIFKPAVKERITGFFRKHLVEE